MPGRDRPERSCGTPVPNRDWTEAPRTLSRTAERCIAEIARKTAGHRFPASTLQTLILEVSISETSILQISRMNRATRSVIHSRGQHHDSREELCL